MEQIQEASSSINETPKPKVDVEALQSRIHNLEELIVRMAHQSGVAHTLLKKAGLEPYTPTKGDMSRFKVG